MPGLDAKAGAAETSKARDKAEPVKTFFNFILNTPFLIQLYYYIKYKNDQGFFC
ncbi:hypothetical protein MUS_2389 [Bacillus velezensis YAU B9601-Y2]|uniref:Uncharacterized protein n=1 Tax=Bacillus amyloliquefaciens (strain Y2) TaxID=1155777 RepID=I2C6Q8_BACAY|nr:hypothetical protein MUS_2389 [Bacillus velezensis YAU B9601-Y2]